MKIRRVEIPPCSFRIRYGGNGTPVVLLHGLSGSMRWWDRNFDALAESHAVAAVELVGFGGNRRFVGSPLPLPVEETVSLLARWLSEEWDEPVHLVGHSMGGQLAIEIAARVPDRIRSLTLVASTGAPFGFRPRSHIRALLRPPPGLVSFAPRLAIDALRAGPGSLALASMQILARDSRAAMEGVGAPALLVWGDSDPLVPLEYAEAILDRIPHARLQVLERAGHIAMWDQPAAFNRRVLDFFRDVEQGSELTRPRPKGERAPEFSWAIDGVAAGIGWRATPSSPRAILIHGLGIGTRYFRGLARALHERGIESAAPDLPGIGFSEELRPYDHEAVARALLEWAASAAVEDAVWIGHSTGCQIVEAVRRLAPAPPLAVHIAPVWTLRPWPWVRLPARLAFDGLREPWGLLAEAARAYWDAGAIRIVRHAAAARRDLDSEILAPERTLAVAGRRDPLVDRTRLAALNVPTREIEGGHGIVWTNPGEIADLIREFMGRA